MTKEMIKHINTYWVEGVDFVTVGVCSSCITVLNPDIYLDPKVKEYLKRTSKNN